MFIAKTLNGSLEEFKVWSEILHFVFPLPQVSFTMMPRLTACDESELIAPIVMVSIAAASHQASISTFFLAQTQG